MHTDKIRNQLTKKTFENALERIGIRPGDTIFVHSDLRSFGIPENVHTKEEILNFYFSSFQKILGKEGTLSVPAYFYEFARHGEPFDTELSPVSKPLGSFSAFVNSLPGRVRSFSPMQSFAIIGAQAKELCGTSLQGYGVASPWHRLRMMGGKIVFVGTTMQPMTYVHHIEQQYGVPHLYNKIYPYPVYQNGTLVPGQVISTVRYLDYAIEYDLRFLQAEMERRGLLRMTDCGSGKILAVDAEEVFQVGLELLQKNPYCFLKKDPAFVPGEIPLK
jgi:aminoglycoside 3-N-acetyltransferase